VNYSTGEVCDVAFEFECLSIFQIFVILHSPQLNKPKNVYTCVCNVSNDPSINAIKRKYIT